MKRAGSLIAAILLTVLYVNVKGQGEQYILDRVVGVVGDFTILQSDIEQELRQMKMSGAYLPPDARCRIFNNYINQKLLLAQAKIDSVEVGPDQVEMAMNARMDYFLNYFGSEEEMEAYLQKSIFDIRADMQEAVREQMISEQVQSSILEDVTTTPSDVRSFFKALPKDSIPYINSQVKLLQIVAYPPYSEEAVFEVKEKLLELRKRVMEGEEFGTLAVLYSEGPSASRRGEIGYLLRSELDPEYAQTAWALKEGQVSKIVESGFGFHIIQLIDRRGDRINTRHILMKPKADAGARQKAISKLDSLKTVIEADSISFEMAAKLYSEDENTSVNGGLIVNQETNAATFELDDLSTKDYYIVRNMQVGDISEPYETEDDNGKTCYKIIMLKDRTEPHLANLKQDYLLLQTLALQKKKMEVMNNWYLDKRANTYIRIDHSFRQCLESELTGMK
ncbi:MAG: peptidylprolyl isomerase [Bacteroidales bacterium]|nr:peptidylprolyl isomerase [Bacteroidales bacterium]MBN2699519.1 peptidylprolyl isomerase [Bacteroidales bacterium]